MLDDKGDITDLNSTIQNFKGVDAVFHLASLIDLRSWAHHYAKLFNVNVVGTANVVEACVANNVKALVYTGSFAARFDAPELRAEGRVENNKSGKNNIFDMNPDGGCSWYAKTKCLAEREGTSILVLFASLLRCSSVNPVCVFGHGDRFQMDRHYEYALKNEATKGVVDYKEAEKGFLSWSYNVNVARLHVLAMKALLDPSKRDSVGGETFYAVDFNMDYYEFSERICDAFQKASKGGYTRKDPVFSIIPRWIVKILGTAATAVDWYYRGTCWGDIYQLSTEGKKKRNKEKEKKIKYF